MNELCFFVCIADEEITFSICEFWICEGKRINFFFLILFNFKNFLLFNVPNKYSHTVHSFHIFPKILFVNLLTISTQKITLIFFNFFLSSIDPSILFLTQRRNPKYIVLHDFLMNFSNVNSFKRVTLFQKMFLMVIQKLSIMFALIFRQDNWLCEIACRKIRFNGSCLINSWNILGVDKLK